MQIFVHNFRGLKDLLRPIHVFQATLAQENKPNFRKCSVNHVILNKHLMCAWYEVDAKKKKVKNYSSC